jgi:hypothetical protein
VIANEILKSSNETVEFDRGEGSMLTAVFLNSQRNGRQEHRNTR